jgi:hypothetical protein
VRLVKKRRKEKMRSRRRSKRTRRKEVISTRHLFPYLMQDFEVTGQVATQR